MSLNRIIWNKMSQIDILCHRVKSPVPRMGYVLWSHWSKGSYGNLQTLGHGRTLQLDAKALLFISLNIRKSNWCPTRRFTPTDSWYQKVLCKLPKEKDSQHHPTTNLETYQPQRPDCKIYLCNHSTNVTGGTNHFFMWFKAHSLRWNPHLTPLSGIALETRQVTGLGKKQILLLW